jgi:hypothetical protein
VNTEPKTKLEISGSANPDYLRGGQFVEFAGTVQDKEIVGKIKEITIMSLKGSSHAGSVPARTAAKKDTLADSFLDAGQVAKIIGRLGKFHDNKWSLQAGGKTYQVELADNVKIHVKLNDGHLITSGDKVTIKGKMIRGKSGVCVAEDIKVTLAQPLSGPKKNPKASLKQGEKGTDRNAGGDTPAPDEAPVPEK